ncbi:hypothetical protein [Tsukamurella tyrosinosolvens]|uniref:hypothetical protein n=1 Tax=Tsukamurella tyrosinosolvens TaxID=57704 RepID=UPI003462E46F
MSTDQADRAIAAIDAVLTDDQIDDIVDWQLSRYDQRTGYDYSIGQPRCAHCGGDEHHLAITERIEEMRDWGLYDETYRYDEDTSRVVCPGSFVPGPVGFRRAFEHSDHVHWAPSNLDAEGYSRGGYIPPRGSDLMIYDEAWEVIRTPAPWELLREMVSAAMAALGPAFDAAAEAVAAMGGAAAWLEDPPPAVPDVDPARLTVRLFTEAGRPVRLGRTARVVSYEQTVTGFTVEVDGRFTRSFGVPHRILIDGPGGPRERIAGIVTELSSTPGGPIRIGAASEHRRLPTVYTEPEENQR